MNESRINLGTNGDKPEETLGCDVNQATARFSEAGEIAVRGSQGSPSSPPISLPIRDLRGPADLRSSVPSVATEKDWQEAAAKAQFCNEFHKLMADGSLSLNQAARAVGKHPSWFSGPDSPYQRWLRGGVAGLLRQASASPSTNISMEVPDWFIPAARFFYLLTNRTRVGGSIPEAVRRTISLPHVPVGWQEAMKRKLLKAINSTPQLLNSPLLNLPECPADLREKILAREKAGQELVTERIARKITAREATIRQYRHQTNAALDYLCSPGSLFFIHDSKTGQRRPPVVGEVIEADDATINFPVCVPWTLGGDPCSEKYGVKVGRFQWLVAVDVARRFITAWSYVMRPKSSYRAEDILTLLRAHCLQHGKPLRAHFEQGAWKSNLVKTALQGLGIELHTVWSPHQKPFIEGLFNTVWTKLSVQFPGCDIGRFMGETEEANDLLTACKRGGRDPRRHFPMLADALTAFGNVVKEKNNTPVDSAIGSWIPAEAWQARPRPSTLDPESDWLFAPYIRTWTVRGMLVGGRIPLFEDLSVPFDFSADFLPQYHGAKVRVHFDPSANRCSGMLVLAEDFHGERAGKVLGLAQQINEIAGYARLVLGWGDDPTNAGRLARQRAASALRREVRAVVPGTAGVSPAYSLSEQRDGISKVAKLEIGSQQSEVSPPASDISAPASDLRPLTSDNRAARLAELAAFEKEHEQLFQ
jgi:hypothetical protein